MLHDRCRLRTIRLGGPRSAGALSLWRTVSALVEQHALTTAAREYPLLSTELERMLVATLVETHPVQVSTGAAPVGRVTHAALRRAAALVESEPERPYRTSELAAVAGLSTRALQEGFRRHYGTTPLGYLRWVRLRRVHADLLHADPPPERR